MAGPDLQKAVLWAVERHQGQWREGNDPLPYVSHPLEVLALCRHEGEVIDHTMLCAAALHDLIEETETTLTELKREFGQDTASLVGELTRKEPTPEQIQGISKDEVWQLRADMLVDEVSKMSSRAQTVKLCDRISNLREATTAKKGEKLARYVRQSRRILDVVPRKTNKRLWVLLENEVKELGG